MRDSQRHSSPCDTCATRTILLVFWSQLTLLERNSFPRQQRSNLSHGFSSEQNRASVPHSLSLLITGLSVSEAHMTPHTPPPPVITALDFCIQTHMQSNLLNNSHNHLHANNWKKGSEARGVTRNLLIHGSESLLCLDPQGNRAGQRDRRHHTATQPKTPSNKFSRRLRPTTLKHFRSHPYMIREERHVCSALKHTAVLSLLTRSTNSSDPTQSDLHKTVITAVQQRTELWICCCISAFWSL